MKNIVILTGAGISAESGLKTFRAHDGLWEEHRIEDVATPEGFARDPLLVHRFYNARREQLQRPGIGPNAAHLALARLEQQFSGMVTVVTQNIDDLHERAGTSNLMHMHGELLKARCPVSQQVVEWKGPLSVEDHCTCCQFPSPLRPHVVWFGEMPLHLDTIYARLAKADLFISIGTSGSVYPAAGFVHEAASNGAHTIEVNLEPSAVESHFNEKIMGLASVEVPRLVALILSNPGS